VFRTYTVYLRNGGGDDASFIPCLCRSDTEALSQARALLAEHPECEAVEVFFGGDLLFRVEGRSTA
jgi:hypothetical protein